MILFDIWNSLYPELILGGSTHGVNFCWVVRADTEVHFSRSREGTGSILVYKSVSITCRINVWVQREAHPFDPQARKHFYVGNCLEDPRGVCILPKGSVAFLGESWVLKHPCKRTKIGHLSPSTLPLEIPCLFLSLILQKQQPLHFIHGAWNFLLKNLQPFKPLI